jgi:hypothetical protein
MDQIVVFCPVARPGKQKPTGSVPICRLVGSHPESADERIGDLSRTELEWQVLIPGSPVIRTRRCSSFAEANRPKTTEVANVPRFSDYYLLLSQRECDIVLLESQRKVLWATSPMFCRARWR